MLHLSCSTLSIKVMLLSSLMLLSFSVRPAEDPFGDPFGVEKEPYAGQEFSALESPSGGAGEYPSLDQEYGFGEEDSFLGEDSGYSADDDDDGYVADDEQSWRAGLDGSWSEDASGYASQGSDMELYGDFDSYGSGMGLDPMGGYPGGGYGQPFGGLGVGGLVGTGVGALGMGGMGLYGSMHPSRRGYYDNPQPPRQDKGGSEEHRKQDHRVDPKEQLKINLTEAKLKNQMERGEMTLKQAHGAATAIHAQDRDSLRYQEALAAARAQVMQEHKNKKFSILRSPLTEEKLNEKAFAKLEKEAKSDPDMYSFLERQKGLKVQQQRLVHKPRSTPLFPDSISRQRYSEENVVFVPRFYSNTVAAGNAGFLGVGLQAPSTRVPSSQGADLLSRSDRYQRSGLPAGNSAPLLPQRRRVARSSSSPLGDVGRKVSLVPRASTDGRTKKRISK